MEPRILIIDDDPLVGKTVARYLRHCGYAVETAESGFIALEKSRNNLFDLIISDMRMPGMSGVETLRKIRSMNETNSRPPTPAIIITGFADEESKKEAHSIGISGYINKPFEMEDFINTVRQHLLN